jgi:uncharacterized protein
MKRVLILAASVVGLSVCAMSFSRAEDSLLSNATTSPTSAPAKLELEVFTMVFLRTGDNPPSMSKEETAELFKGHFTHLQKMGAAGKMVVAGPFGAGDVKGLRGMCLYRVGMAEAKALAAEDPTVKAGVFKVEAQTWACQKGALTFPMATTTQPAQ